MGSLSHAGRTDTALMADAIRFLAVDAVQAAKSGHPGMPMGMADVATVLFNEFIKINPADPHWPDRDRFVLSAGHGSMLHYAVNHLLGYEDMTIDQLRNFRQLGSIAAGHPEHGVAMGVETTTGPLGQGLANAVGMALAERLLGARFGEHLVDHNTWVIAGDGCLQEGISHEAIDLAGHLGLSKLTVFWDDNGISIDGDVGLASSMDQMARFTAAGWHVTAIDGHDANAIRQAVAQALASDQPALIACRTTIGFGAPNLAGTAKTHGAPLGDAEIAATRDALDWPHAPFVIPDDIRATWSLAATRSVPDYEAWLTRLAEASQKDAFLAAQDGKIGDEVTARLAKLKAELFENQTALATRQASQKALEVINATTPMTIGGSADLTGSNLTKTEGMEVVSPGRQETLANGRYIHFGIREHAMAAAMTGMALHRGVIPYGGTFLVFSDYARGAIRLSALMKQRVIYVLTHDSIGLGEDGPTHQPVEHLAMLRATPNLLVLRPCDAIETAEAWEVALASRESPSVIALSRQSTPCVRHEQPGRNPDQNMVQCGGYVVRDARSNRNITLLASGTEVAIALQAADMLHRHHQVDAAVVSMPCWELFEQQSQDRRRNVLGTAPRLAIEAAGGFGWERYVDDSRHFIGMTGFGDSGPAEALYSHFGITSDAIVLRALEVLGR